MQININVYVFEKMYVNMWLAAFQRCVAVDDDECD